MPSFFGRFSGIVSLSLTVSVALMQSAVAQPFAAPSLGSPGGSLINNNTNPGGAVAAVSPTQAYCCYVDGEDCKEVVSPDVCEQTGGKGSKLQGATLKTKKEAQASCRGFCNYQVLDCGSCNKATNKDFCERSGDCKWDSATAKCNDSLLCNEPGCPEDPTKCVNDCAECAFANIAPLDFSTQDNDEYIYDNCETVNFACTLVEGLTPTSEHNATVRCEPNPQICRRYFACCNLDEPYEPPFVTGSYLEGDPASQNSPEKNYCDNILPVTIKAASLKTDPLSVAISHPDKHTYVDSDYPLLTAANFSRIESYTEKELATRYNLSPTDPRLDAAANFYMDSEFDLGYLNELDTWLADDLCKIDPTYVTFQGSSSSAGNNVSSSTSTTDVNAVEYCCNDILASFGCADPGLTGVKRCQGGPADKQVCNNRRECNPTCQQDPKDPTKKACLGGSYNATTCQKDADCIITQCFDKAKSPPGAVQCYGSFVLAKTQFLDGGDCRRRCYDAGNRGWACASIGGKKSCELIPLNINSLRLKASVFSASVDFSGLDYTAILQKAQLPTNQGGDANYARCQAECT